MARTLEDHMRAYANAEAAGDTEAMQAIQAAVTGSGSFLERLGAGVEDARLGALQVIGRGDRDEIKEHNRIAEQATGPSLGGKLTRGLGAAGMLAPALLFPGAQSVAGAAALGAAGGLIEPTEDENVIGGKVKNAALGAATGGLMQKGLNVAGPVLKKTLGKAREYLPGGARIAAEREFVGAIPQGERAAAEQALTGASAARTAPYASGVSGAPITSAVATRQPALLSAEREAREAGGALGMPFRDLDEQAAQARWQHLQQNVGGDVRALSQTAEDVHENFMLNAKMRLPFDSKDVLGQEIVGSLNQTKNKAIQAELERILDQYVAAKSAGDVTSLHELRMTAFDDALSRLYQSDKKAAGMLRNRIQEFKNTFDREMNRSLGQGKWSQYLAEYSQAARARGQAQAGNELLGQLATKNETPGGVPSLTGSRQQLAREASATNDFGQEIYSPAASDAMTTVRREIGEQALPYAQGPRGSATAQNLNPTSPVLSRAIAAQQRAAQGLLSPWNVAMAGAGAATGNPVAGLGIVAGRGLLDRRALAIAQQLIQLHVDPARAAQALAQANLPPQVKSAVMQQLQQYAQRAGAATGGAMAAQPNQEQ